MRTIRTKVYQFSELNDKAKQKAIAWGYDLNVDHDWWDFIYEDFKTLCELIGIDVDLSKTYFSGFAHQGQGASFTADINMSQLINGINKKTYLTHAPEIEKEANFSPDLCTIDKRVIDLINRELLDVSAYATANDRPYSTKVSFSAGYELDCTHTHIETQLNKLESWLEDIINELDSMLFKLLESSYDYLTSEEAITETIEANEYEFKEDGTRF